MLLTVLAQVANVILPGNTGTGRKLNYLTGFADQDQ
jgi:hypothetical protein